MVNGVEHPRQYTVKGVKNEAEAETKLNTMCEAIIIITSIHEVL